MTLITSLCCVLLLMLLVLFHCSAVRIAKIRFRTVPSYTISAYALQKYSQRSAPSAVKTLIRTRELHRATRQILQKLITFQDGSKGAQEGKAAER
jgi:hypothetical protein